MNALKDDVPVQGRIATGVRGIALREGDKAVMIQQCNGEGEVIVVTNEGKFKRVITSLIDVGKRNRKGSIIVALKGDEHVLCASVVAEPYALAVVGKDRSVSEISSEDILISVASTMAKKLRAFAEGSIENVYPMPYKKIEE